MPGMPPPVHANVLRHDAVDIHGTPLSPFPFLGEEPETILPPRLDWRDEVIRPDHLDDPLARIIGQSDAADTRLDGQNPKVVYNFGRALGVSVEDLEV